MLSTIEICNDKVKILQAAKRGKNIQITLCKEYFGNANDEVQRTEVVDKLNEGKRRLGKTTLLINNDAVLYREMKLPSLDPKKMRAVISNEIKTSQNQNDVALCDYLDLEEAEDGKMRILTCSIAKSTLENYMKLTDQVKANLKRIDVGYDALFNYVNGTVLRNKNTPYLIVDISQRMARFFLFDNGIFILMRNTRLPYLGNLNETVELLLAEISRMNQFQLSRHFQANIQDIFLFGEHDQMNSILEFIRSRMEIQVDFLPKANGIQVDEQLDYLSYVYAMGALIGK